MHFKRSKSTLDSLKNVFNVFRRKPSLGAPEDRLLWTSTKCPFKRDVYLIESQIKGVKKARNQL